MLLLLRSAVRILETRHWQPTDTICRLGKGHVHLYFHYRTHPGLSLVKPLMLASLATNRILVNHGTAIAADLTRSSR